VNGIIQCFVGSSSNHAIIMDVYVFIFLDGMYTLRNVCNTDSCVQSEMFMIVPFHPFSQVKDNLGNHGLCDLYYFTCGQKGNWLWLEGRE
jgi:hypothetical protein